MELPFRFILNCSECRVHASAHHLTIWCHTYEGLWNIWPAYHTCRMTCRHKCTSWHWITSGFPVYFCHLKQLFCILNYFYLKAEHNGFPASQDASIIIHKLWANIWIHLNLIKGSWGQFWPQHRSMLYTLFEPVTSYFKASAGVKKGPQDPYWGQNWPKGTLLRDYVLGTLSKVKVIWKVSPPRPGCNYNRQQCYRIHWEKREPKWLSYTTGYSQKKIFYNWKLLPRSILPS